MTFCYETFAISINISTFVNRKRTWAKKYSIEETLMPLENEKRHDLIESGKIIEGDKVPSSELDMHRIFYKYRKT